MVQGPEDRVQAQVEAWVEAVVAGVAWAAPVREQVPGAGASAHPAATRFLIRRASLVTIGPVPSVAPRWSEDSIHEQHYTERILT